MTAMTDKERKQEIERLREVLRRGKFTVVEMASIRGRIGGLVGAGHPGRRLGGIRGAEARWGKTRKSSDRRKDPVSPRGKRKK
jgi:hypothetical protein